MPQENFPVPYRRGHKKTDLATVAKSVANAGTGVLASVLLATYLTWLQADRPNHHE